MSKGIVKALTTLGRIEEHLGILMDADIFELPARPKDMCDWFGELSDEKKDDYIHKISYSIQNLGEQIGDIWSLARGDDEC